MRRLNQSSKEKILPLPRVLSHQILPACAATMVKSPEFLVYLTEMRKEDFTAAANGAYFVSNVAICTLPTAVGAAGQEIVVCNTNKSGTITYQTVLGEMLGSDESGPVVNSIPGKVDRFISDGKGWYRE
jgi:hypothetical protein